MSRQARIPDEKPQLSFDELVATARAILINTHDSVSTAMINILFKVATDAAIAEQFYKCVDDDRRMGRFVEELLRLEPPQGTLSFDYYASDAGRKGVPGRSAHSRSLRVGQ